MAQNFIEAGQQYKNIKTGEIKMAEGVQDVGAGKKGQFLSADFEVLPKTQVQPQTLKIDEIKIPTEIKREDLGVSSSTLETENENRNKMLARVQESYQAVGGDAKANEAFIQGVAQAKFNRPANKKELELAGSSLKDVIGSFGLEMTLPNFGVEKNVEQLAPQGQDLQKTQKDLNVIKEDVSVGKITPELKLEQSKKTVFDKLADLSKAQSEGTAEAQKEFGLASKADEVNRINKEINDLRTEIQKREILDIAEMDELADRPIPNSLIAGKQNNLSREQKLDLMLAQNNYNNKLVELQIAQGAYDKAEQLVKETAEDKYQNAQTILEAAKLQYSMDEAEVARLNEEAKFERDLGLNGYVELKSPSDIAMVGTNNVYTDPVSGKKYLRPQVSSIESIKSMPSSYQEWYLAGGDLTGKSYQEWLVEDTVKKTGNASYDDIVSQYDLSDNVETAINTSLAGLKFGTVADKNGAKSTLAYLVANGKTDEAKDLLKRYVFNNASSSQQDVVAGNEKAIKALDRVDTLLDTYVAKNGDTSIFTGLTEEGLRKVGETLGEGELAELANAIGMTLIDYRRAVSGAAFTESEARAYERLFPSIGNTPEVNSSLISELKTMLKMGADNFYQQRIGEKNYKTLFGNETQSWGNLPAITQSYQSLDSLAESLPEYAPVIEQALLDYPDYTDNEILQIIQTPTDNLLVSAVKAFPDGSTGGQCGDFAHKIVDFPAVGDYKKDKIASVEKYGKPIAMAQVGDVIITGENPIYGHVAVINEVEGEYPNLTFKLTESNYKRSNTVSHDRKLKANSGLLYGVIPSKIKNNIA
jgi:hypothetical protein